MRAKKTTMAVIGVVGLFGIFALTRCGGATDAETPAAPAKSPAPIVIMVQAPPPGSHSIHASIPGIVRNDIRDGDTCAIDGQLGLDSKTRETLFCKPVPWTTGDDRPLRWQH